MNNQQQSSSDNTGKIVRGAVKLGSAAAKAASGNVAGAAKDAAESGVLKVVFKAIFGFFIVIFLCLSAVPATITGQQTGFMERAGEQIGQDADMAGKDLEFDVLNDIPGNADIFSESTREMFFSVIKFKIQSLLGFDTSDTEISISEKAFKSLGFSEDGGEDIMASTTLELLDKTLDRYAVRRDQYEKLLKKVSKYFENNYHSDYLSSGADEYRVNSPVFSTPSLSRLDALNAVAMYNVQMDAAASILNSVKASTKTYMSWLGDTYHALDNSDSGYHCTGTDKTFSTKQWYGDCLYEGNFEEYLQDRYDNPGLTLDKEKAFSYIAATYYVDKDNGIVADTDIITETRIDDEGDEYEVTVFVVTVKMNVTFIGYNGIQHAIGLWDGSFEDEQPEQADYINLNIPSTVPEKITTFEWVKGDKKYTRQFDYQTDYFDSIREMLCEYIGDEMYGTTEAWGGGNGIVFSSNFNPLDLTTLDYSALGGVAPPIGSMAERVCNIARSQYGTTGGSRYGAGTGNNQTEWCGLFVNWVCRQAGCGNLTIGKGRNGIQVTTASCTDAWCIFGGTFGGSTSNPIAGTNDHGAAILFDQTVMARGTGYIPQAGDFVIFAKADRSPAHIGIVYSYNSDTNALVTIEGNTGNGDTAAQRKVSSRNRTTTVYKGNQYHVNPYNILGFIHPNY